MRLRREVSCTEQRVDLPNMTDDSLDIPALDDDLQPARVVA
jgi:hypothetical protein